MGRALRAIDPEYPYHVICRGSNRGLIVFDDADCEEFAAELERVASFFGWQVYAWCLMPNHHHVVLQAQQEAFSLGFQQLNGNHSRRTNARHGRTDHLFRNRPRAIRCHGTSHLIGAIAYVVRNPVAAKLVSNAADWPWSSYRGTMGLASAPSWLLVAETLELFGTTFESARLAFDRLVHTGRLVVSDTIELPLAL
jgi:REP element-mobilizing transposase RayT